MRNITTANDTIKNIPIRMRKHQHIIKNITEIISDFKPVINSIRTATIRKIARSRRDG